MRQYDDFTPDAKQTAGAISLPALIVLAIIFEFANYQPKQVGQSNELSKQDTPVETIHKMQPQQSVEDMTYEYVGTIKRGIVLYDSLHDNYQTLPVDLNVESVQNRLNALKENKENRPTLTLSEWRKYVSLQHPVQVGKKILHVSTDVNENVKQ